MDLPTRRERTIVEHVIDTGVDGQGIDAKQFDFSYAYIKNAMQSDGVDFGYDDCFRVIARDGEIVFTYPKSGVGNG